MDFLPIANLFNLKCSHGICLLRREKIDRYIIPTRGTLGHFTSSGRKTGKKMYIYIGRLIIQKTEGNGT